jgi:chemotaxis protein histidine kinase CheA
VLEMEVFSDDDRSQILPIGVDAVGTTEEVLVRPLSSLVARVGPFAGAVVRGDGSLRLTIDVDALAPRIRSWLRAAEGRASDRPPRSSPDAPPRA